MNNWTILIVDDEKVIRDILVGMLEIDGDSTLLTASNGMEALEVYQNNQIDLIFTNVGIFFLVYPSDH